MILLLILAFSGVLDHYVKVLSIIVILSVFTIAIDANYCVSMSLIFVGDASILRIIAV